MIVSVFETSTGKILRIVDAPVAIAQTQAQSGESWVVGKANDLTQYVNCGVITDKPAMTGGLSKNTITTAELAVLAGPEGATATIAGPVSGLETIDADGLEIGSDVPGIYTIKISLFPYLDAEYQLEIIEA